jgi:2-methylcitrate dehydratase PrpD
MSVTQEVSNHLVALSYDDLDEMTIARVKTRLLDALGVIAVGHTGPCCSELLSLLKTYGSAPQSSVIARGGGMMPASHAAMMNSFMMRSFDFEAIEAEGENRASCAAHISGTTVPVALSVAEREHASGKEFITALALGDDLAARLAVASGFDVYGGWDNTGTVNGLGGTAVAGKLIGLDAKRMGNALGIALNQLSGSIDNINDKTLAFKLPMALAARNSVFSADFAARGMTATHDAIAGAKGFFFLFCGENIHPEGVTRGLGEVFYGDRVIKPWSACRATHPSIDACMQIVENHEIEPETIKEIVVHTTPRTAKGFVGQPFEVGEDPQVCGAFSILFTAANSILRKSIRPEHFAPEKMGEPALQRLLDVTRIDPSLPSDEYQTSTVDIALDDGATLSARCDVPKGDIYRSPMGRGEILDKYYTNIEVSGLGDRELADKVIKIVEHLEEVEDMGTVIDLVLSKTR